MLSKLFLLSFAAFAVAGPSPRASCADVTVIFARGTTESEPIGTIVGPPLQAALTAALGSKTLNFVGVNYPASIAGFLEGGDPQGATTMANDVTSALSSCPNTEIVVSGYRSVYSKAYQANLYKYLFSQGGQLVHLAVPKLSSSVQSKLKAIVIFGDPDNGQSFPGNLNAIEKTFCAVGDDICLGGDLILPAHLSYGAVSSVFQHNTTFVNSCLGRTCCCKLHRFQTLKRMGQGWEIK